MWMNKRSRLHLPSAPARPGEAHDRDVAAEHVELCELALARDTDRAVEALAAHIELTTKLLLESRFDELSESDASASPESRSG